MWRIGGYVFIERLGERLGELLSYPWQGVFPGPGQPSIEDLEAYARQRAAEFLGVIEDTASHRRSDYGAIGDVVVVFATFSF
jgi:hypothetical protein